MKEEKSRCLDAIIQQKLVISLRKGESESMARVKNDYFYLIKQPLIRFIDDVQIIEDKSIKIILQLVEERFLKRKKEIVKSEDIATILIEEAIEASAGYCDSDMLDGIKMEMNALKEIFLQIEKLDEKYRLPIRMSFGGKEQSEIEKESKLPMDILLRYIKEGAKLIKTGLEMEEKDEAAEFYSSMIYDIVFYE